MSEIWKFSTSSEPNLRRLLETVNNLDEDKEWMKKFRRSTEACRNYFNDHNANITDNKTQSSESYTEEINTDNNCATKTLYNNVDLDFCNCIDSEPTSRLDYMIEECLKRPDLISNLAEHLIIGSIEKLLQTILSKPEINKEFISIFTLKFFPIFLRREQSWLAIDFLLKTYKIFPEAFKPLLLLLIKDINIPNLVLQELLQNSMDLQKNFMILLPRIDITKDVFKHHLNTLYIIYKDSIKQPEMQHFMQSLIIENAPHCSDDKNYGRLLLAFLQAQKCLKIRTDCGILLKVVEHHKSPFKRPCLAVLNEIENNEP